MSIFKRTAPDVQQATAPSSQAGTETLMAPGATPGVVPPAAAPIYSTRPAEPARVESEPESVVAEKVRVAREAQQSAQERVRVAVSRARGPVAAPGVQRRRVVPAAAATPMAPSTALLDPQATAQTGMLHLAWRWQEAGAPIRAVHTYVELLRRYPGTAAAAAAVTDLVNLSEKLANEGQFHTALAIYDHLEELA